MPKILALALIAAGLAWGQTARRPRAAPRSGGGCTQWVFNPYTGKQDCTSTAAGGGTGGGAAGQVLKWSLGVTGTVAVNEQSVQSNQPTVSTTLNSCSAHADTAPAGSALTIDVLNGGTSVLTAPLSIPAGANDSAIVTTFANANITPTSTLTVKALAVGSTTAGGYVLVKCDTAGTGGGSSVVYPSGPGIVTMGSSTWGPSLAAPSGTIVGTTDTQTLANKTVDGIGPTIFGYLSNLTSDVQAQLNGKAASNATMNVQVAGAASGATCALGGSCTLPAPPGSGGGGTGGIPAYADSSGSGGTTNYTVAIGATNGAGGTCNLSDLYDGFMFTMMPAHNAAGGATTITYCGAAAKTVYVKGATNGNLSLAPNAIIQSTTAVPRTYAFIYHASPIDKFELIQNIRLGTDAEAQQDGTDISLATNMPQVKWAISNLSPCSTIGTIGQDCGSTVATGNATAHEPWVNPGSGRTWRIWKANGTTTFDTDGMAAVATNAVAGNGAVGQVLKWSLGVTGTIVTGEVSIQSNQPTVTTTLNSCSAHADTAPVGSAMTIDVLKSGTSIFGANPLITIPAGANDSAIVTTFADSSVGPTSALIVRAAAVGSTTSGGYVLVKCDTATAAASGTVVAPTSSSTPLQLKFTSATQASNGYVIISAATSPIYTGSSPKLSVGLQYSDSVNISWLAVLIADSLKTLPSPMLWTSGNAPGAMAGFRYNPLAGDTDVVCISAPNGGVAPTTAHTGLSGAAITNPSNLSVYIDDSGGGAIHFFNGPPSSSTEICTGTSWAGNLPGGTRLSPYIGIYQRSGFAGAASVSLAYLALGANQ